jgi:hypothetical protein
MNGHYRIIDGQIYSPIRVTERHRARDEAQRVASGGSEVPWGPGRCRVTAKVVKLETGAESDDLSNLKLSPWARDPRRYPVIQIPSSFEAAAQEE